MKNNPPPPYLLTAPRNIAKTIEAFRDLRIQKARLEAKEEKLRDRIFGFADLPKNRTAASVKIFGPFGEPLALVRTEWFDCLNTAQLRLEKPKIYDAFLEERRRQSVRIY